MAFDENQYVEEMGRWVDEADKLADGFKALFPKTSEGTMRYLFTLHYMQAEFCQFCNIEMEDFGQYVTFMVALWHKMGRPDPAGLSSEVMSEMFKRIKVKREKGTT